MSFWFGCRHKRTSFPITLPKHARPFNGFSKTYIVCLECGREMPYDWDEMKFLRRRAAPQAQPDYEPAHQA